MKQNTKDKLRVFVYLNGSKDLYLFNDQDAKTMKSLVLNIPVHLLYTLALLTVK